VGRSETSPELLLSQAELLYRLEIFAIELISPHSLTSPFELCYALGTMSAINGDKARFNRERKGKLARRLRSRLLRTKITPQHPARPGGGQL
jgi:hypothetical protein